MAALAYSARALPRGGVVDDLCVDCIIVGGVERASARQGCRIDSDRVGIAEGMVSKRARRTRANGDQFASSREIGLLPSVARRSRSAAELRNSALVVHQQRGLWPQLVEVIGCRDRSDLIGDLTGRMRLGDV
jgi:hypothetical protein